MYLLFRRIIRFLLQKVRVFFFELGTWNLELGTWNLEPGICEQPKKRTPEALQFVFVSTYHTSAGGISHRSAYSVLKHDKEHPLKNPFPILLQIGSFHM